VTTHPNIPFNRPSLEGRELEYVADAARSGELSCDGPYSRRAAALLKEALGVEEVLLTTSCTAALELSALLADVAPGDVVVLPSFTYVSTALAFARAGARLRFADIEPVTLGIDPRSVADLLTPEVAAVVPVHYAGIGCDIDGLVAALNGRAVSMIEDNAHGLFGAIGDRPLGSFGRFSCLSFHDTKSFGCGEGGAIAITDRADVERAHVLYDKGTNRRAFVAGEVDAYTWVDIGSSFGLADLLAAHLWGQLEARDRILEKRRAITERYVELLTPEADRLGIQLMQRPADRRSAEQMFYVLVDTRERRDAVLAALRSAGIGATFHYVPLHDAPGAKAFLDVETDCPVATDISGRLLRLPFYNALGPDDVAQVATSLVRALERTSPTSPR